ncbi:RICIN domain-containing protein [Rhodoferax saidenbachensis]|uniref:Ricin B lectin domain-containing protein n=1 Tax=Rhodoferax saidenbachensis TaxID=1484693 RepID=A0ABU1ZS67_9BURK|nr:RICIN domain-containing protein [Rhodoferax saidenbachensis]MDR7308402.1 hypothetical protein [Rhodoferax saidenbachensis]
MTLVSGLLAVRPAVAGDESIGVNFAVAGGAPQYLASGIIYGMTENGSLPQDHFFTDIKWNYMRAGGAQLDNPGGWVGGTYPRRWNATKAQAIRTAALGGQFVMLVHDLWGADAETNASVFPGDSGNWANYDAFLNQLISDVQASGVNVQWDIWNEPDIGTFWQRNQTQYLEMWKRGYQRIRTAFPNAVIVGPSTSRPPTSQAGSWWSNYLDYAKANSVLPNIYSYHALPGDPVATTQVGDQMLAARNIQRTTRYQINEYAATGEQKPSHGAWYISRLERAGANGLRANWALGAGLNDFEAKLLVKTGSQYLPTGEWWTYRYYGSQTGNVVSTTPSASYDAFATKTTGKAQILLGGGGTTGNMAISLTGLNSTSGIVENNMVRIVVQRIPYNGGGAVSSPETISNSFVGLSNNATTVNIARTNQDDGFTITVLPPSDTSFTTAAIARHSNQCLDDTNLSLANGTQQQQYHCEGGTQQAWKFIPVAGVADTFTVVNQLSGKCLDVSGIGLTDGTAIGQWSCIAGAQNQQFMTRKVTYSGNGPKDYQLVARHSGKCVDVKGISTAANAVIHQWTCNPAGQASPLNQTWVLPGR